MSDMLHKTAHKFLLPGKFSDSGLLILLEKGRELFCICSKVSLTQVSNNAVQLTLYTWE